MYHSQCEMNFVCSLSIYNGVLSHMNLTNIIDSYIIGVPSISHTLTSILQKMIRILLSGAK